MSMNKRNLTVRSYAVKPSTLNEKDRSVEAVIATETPTMVFDMQRWEPVQEVLLMSGANHPETIPFVDSHDRGSIAGTIGSTTNLRTENDKLIGKNVFSTTDEGERAWTLTKEKHVQFNSIGYRVDKFTDIEPGKKKTIQGREYVAPADMTLRISTKWTVAENSAVVIPADPSAKNRSDIMKNKDDKTKEQEAVQAERGRIQAIRKLACDKTPADLLQTLIDDGVTVEDAGPRILEAERQERQPVIQGGAPVKRKASTAFSGWPVIEVARRLLQSQGVNVEGMSRKTIARKSFARTDQSVYTLPALLGDTINKSLKAAYFEHPTIWPSIAAKRTVPNFLTITRIDMSEMDDLEALNVHSEYSYGTITDSKETFKVYRYGKIVGVGFEDLVNDNLDGFLEIPGRLAVASRRKEDELVIGFVTANAALVSDSVAFYHADHGNLAGAGGAITRTTLNAGRLAMRVQKGIRDQAFLNLEPYTLVGPAAIEGTIDSYILQERDPADTTKTNEWKGTVKKIIHPRFDDNSATAWYMFCNPSIRAAIEICFLGSQAGGPVVESDVNFETDSRRWKIRHCVGVGAGDYRAGYQNPGA